MQALGLTAEHALFTVLAVFSPVQAKKCLFSFEPYKINITDYPLALIVLNERK